MSDNKHTAAHIKAAIDAAKADAAHCQAELGEPVSVNLMLGELAGGPIRIPQTPAQRAAVGALARAGLAVKGNGMVALTDLGIAAASA